LFSTSEGLKIAYVSGREGPKSDACTFSTDDVSAVRDSVLRNQTNFKGVDILLTSQWPEGAKEVGINLEFIIYYNHLLKINVPKYQMKVVCITLLDMVVSHLSDVYGSRTTMILNNQPL